MRSFCSFLVIRDEEIVQIDRIASRAGWELQFSEDPSNKFSFSDNGFMERSQPSALKIQQPDQTHGQLIKIIGEQTTASNITQLIYAAHNVIECDPSTRLGMLAPFELPEDITEQASIFQNVFQTEGYFEKFTYQPNLSVAIALAAEAWSDMRLVYAIHKLSQSLECKSITWWSALPRHGQVFEKYSEFHSIHVNTASSINLAFSAIEELNLQVLSSLKDKRFMDGDWNPAVLKKTNAKLKEVGIEPDQPVPWIQRGNKTLAEEAIKPKLGKLEKYSDGELVRDRELSLADALHYCSYLRNFMTTHALSSEAQFLGPYEVHNVQSVARRLILSKCGLWNVSAKDL